MAKKKKVVKPKSPRVPKDLKPYVVRKYRTKDRSKRVIVVRMPNSEGYNVQVVSKGALVAVRAFPVPLSRTSVIPTPVWMDTQRELARWYAGHISRKGIPPSDRKERSRRKRYLKRSMAAFNEHLATKQVVRVLQKGVVPTQPKPLLKNAMPYIVIYDPKQSCGTTTFRIHTAYCHRLDFERRKAIRDRGGDSWIVEAKTPEEARTMQLKEFDEGDMGYDASDFEIHKCEQDGDGSESKEKSATRQKRGHGVARQGSAGPTTAASVSDPGNNPVVEDGKETVQDSAR